MDLNTLSHSDLIKVAYSTLLLKGREKEPLFNYQPHLVQNAFHTSKARNRWFFGGNRSGKTTAGAVEGITLSTGEVPKYYMGKGLTPKVPVPNEGWVVSLDYPTSRDVTEPTIRKWLPYRYIKNWSKTDRILELTNGSIIGFKSCDAGWEKFQGSAKHWIWFDEEPDWNVYQECQMRTIDYGGYIFGTMTPLHGMTWVFDDIYEMADNDPDIEVFVSQIYDNKDHLPEEEIKRVERIFTDDEKEARLYGRFIEFAGLIYKDFKKEVHCVAPFRIPNHWTKYMAVDPGINNPTAVVFLAVDPDDNCYVYDEYYETERTVEENAKAIKAIIGNEKGRQINRSLIDPSADAREIGSLQSVRQQYMRAGIFTAPANNDVSAGISAVRELLKINEKTGKPKLFIFNTCTATLKEIVRYRWAQFRHRAEEKNLKERPQKVLDHAMDALRYICVDRPHYFRDLGVYEDSGYQYTSKFTKY